MYVLFQQVGLAIQRGNTASVIVTLPVGEEPSSEFHVLWNIYKYLIIIYNIEIFNVNVRFLCAMLWPTSQF